MYKLLRPLLFLIDPESIHHFTCSILRLALKFPGAGRLVKSLFSKDDPRLRVRLLGLEFRNPVGLAAGFDKNAALIGELAHFGFGFIEIGTITALPQAGN